MRILHVYKDYNPIFGGIENHIQWLAEAQVANGHSVEVLVTNPAGLPPVEIINGVRVIRAGRLATVASTPLSLSFPWHLARLKPDITHLQFPYPLGELSQLLVSRLSAGRRPFILSYQSDVVKQQRILRFYRPLLDRVLRRADLILASSPQYIESSEFLRPLAHRCRPLPLGIDPAPFAPDGADKPAGRPVRIFFMGRHRYYKGLDTLLQALPLVPEAELVAGGDGPMRPEWEALAAELGLDDRVRFLGEIPAADLPDHYRQADLFCLPSNSRAEAFGIVLLEAMAAGLPCVTTELGTGTSFVVQHEQTGLVVPPADPAALAAALNRLVANPALRRQYGAAGRARLLNEFTIEAMVERVEAVYREIVGEVEG